MPRHGGQSQISFSDSFFEWFNHQQMVFSKYPYARMDFWGDLDLVLLVGEQWGVIGKMSDHIYVYYFYNVLVFSKCYEDLIKPIYLCRYWISATNSAPKGSSFHSSRRGYREGCPSRFGRSRHPCSIVVLDRGSHPWYSGCEDRQVTSKTTAPHYWHAEPMD